MILSHWDDVRVADKSGNYQITKNPHFAELFKWLKTWSSSGIAFKTDDWSPDWQPAFADETIGGSLISNWMNGFLPKFAPTQKGKWGLALWPEFNRTGSEAGGGVVCIPKGAKNPEAAFEFASKLWLETKGAVEYWKFNGTPPSTKSAQDEVRKAVATMERPTGISDADWAANPVNYFGRDFMEPTFKAMDVMKVFPYDPKASAELTILRRHAEAYLADKETLEKALAGAEADMKAQLGNPYA
jgi:ABC-type glycerol-3-phosphate transport system substrate-binding protein